MDGKADLVLSHKRRAEHEQDRGQRSTLVSIANGVISKGGAVSLRFRLAKSSSRHFNLSVLQVKKCVPLLLRTLNSCGTWRHCTSSSSSTESVVPSPAGPWEAKAPASAALLDLADLPAPPSLTESEADETHARPVDPGEAGEDEDQQQQVRSTRYETKKRRALRLVHRVQQYAGAGQV